MKNIFQIGDNIDIIYFVEGTKIKDKLTITFIKNDLIYTCGHCFPKNAKTKYGNLVYTSGFDSPNEKEEIAIIKIKPKYLNLFKKIDVTNDFKYIKSNIKTILLNKRKTYNGNIIYYVNKKLPKGWVQLNNCYKINHMIDKLDFPYYLVVVKKLIKNNGFSGSPWLVIQDNKLKLLGGHIGRTEGKYNDLPIEIIYVKPLPKKCYLKF
jgi:hypothetical protein